jgi:putative ABC transport system permease protein
MLKNYIVIAIRNIIKHRTFSFINIFGLAMAMSVCMGIMMLVADQMVMDRHNPLANRIYRITAIPFWKELNGAPGNEYSTTTLPVRDELLTNYAGVEKAVRLMRGFGNHWIEVEPNHDINIPVSGFFADPEVLDLFDHQLLYGDPSTALTEPYTVVLTENAARKLFKAENPVGESLKVGKLGTYKVTGVIKDSKERSHIVADAYASIASVKSLETAGILGNNLDNWHNFTQGWVYILLEEGKEIEDIVPHLARISEDHFSNLVEPNTTVVKYGYQNLLDIIPGKLLNNPIGPFMPWFIVYFLAGLAGIILVTSCFNFTNLSIARSLTRAREIGVRKVTGATRWQLFIQFISESVIVSLFALVLALGIIYLLKPFIEELAFAKFLHWNLSANYLVYSLFLVLAVAVGIVAGLFPAGVLSGFQPVKVLKNLGNTRLMSKIGLRKALLVSQFTIAMIFILTVIVMYRQLSLFSRYDNGFASANKVVIQKGETSVGTLKTELLKQPNIQHVAAASHLPLMGIQHGEEFVRSLEEKEGKSISCFFVDEDYSANMGLTIVAGKFFIEEAGESNRNFIVLNETAVKAFHFDSPADALGEVLIMKSDSSQKQIIGVVKDYHHELFAERLEPLGLLYNADEFKLLQVSYSGSFEDAVKSTEQAWSVVNPGLKVEVKDFEAEMGKLFDIVFGTLIKLLGFIAFLAISISCLGLLGMATYSIESRKKEIAMRKILGVTNGSLVYTLSKGYLIILLLSLAIAVPAAYFLNTFWLENLAYHVTVDFFTVSLGVLILAFFGLFTIGSQTVQATWVNPVENLKSE